MVGWMGGGGLGWFLLRLKMGQSPSITNTPSTLTRGWCTGPGGDGDDGGVTQHRGSGGGAQRRGGSGDGGGVGAQHRGSPERV